MKQVLQVCAFGAPRPGNFIESMLALQQKLRKEGYETIYAFAETAKGKNWCEEIERESKVYFLPVAKARILPKTYLMLKKIYQENDISIVHSHFELYDIPVAVMAPKNVKIIWHLHDAIKENYTKAKVSRRILYKLQYGHLGKRATMMTASELHGRFAIELGFNSDRVVFVPNGINLERINTHYHQNNENSFLMFGWEVHRKGVDLLIDAENEMNSSNYDLVVVGQEECKKYIEENTKSECVRFINPVDDINNLYSGAKVFLHASRAEGLSYALLEVIYFGMYVICSDIPENMFAKEFLGVEYFENGRADQLRKLIEKYIDKNGMEEAAVLKNRALIKKKYSLETWCKSVMEIYFGR